MLKPGPYHPITIEPAKRRWRAMFAGHVIADTDDALILRETDLRPVVYFPRKDVAMEYMSRTDRHTHCPYKGEAAYYTILMDGEFADNAVWSYEKPIPGMEAIAGRVAFYPEKVELYEVDDAAVNPHHRRDEQIRAEEGRSDLPRAEVVPHPMSRAEVDEIIQHTDAGDGRSQREHWPPNVDTPPRPGGGIR